MKMLLSYEQGDSPRVSDANTLRDLPSPDCTYWIMPPATRPARDRSSGRICHYRGTSKNVEVACPSCRRWVAIDGIVPSKLQSGAPICRDCGRLCTKRWVACQRDEQLKSIMHGIQRHDSDLEAAGYHGLPPAAWSQRQARIAQHCERVSLAGVGGDGRYWLEDSDEMRAKDLMESAKRREAKNAETLKSILAGSV